MCLLNSNTFGYVLPKENAKERGRDARAATQPNQNRKQLSFQLFDFFREDLSFIL